MDLLPHARPPPRGARPLGDGPPPPMGRARLLGAPRRDEHRRDGPRRRADWQARPGRQGLGRPLAHALLLRCTWWPSRSSSARSCGGSASARARTRSSKACASRTAPSRPPATCSSRSVVLVIGDRAHGERSRRAARRARGSERRLPGAPRVVLPLALPAPPLLPRSDGVLGHEPRARVHDPVSFW